MKIEEKQKHGRFMKLYTKYLFDVFGASVGGIHGLGIVWMQVVIEIIP